MQLSLFFWNWLRILIDFRFADLRIIRISAFPVYVSSCIWPCRAGWIERIVALKSQFSDQKSNLLSWFYDSLENSYLWLVLPSYLAIYLETWHTVSPVLRVWLLALDSNMAAYQQFLKHINWNFMETGILGIGLWLNLWVNASNEFGSRTFDKSGLNGYVTLKLKTSQ